MALAAAQVERISRAGRQLVGTRRAPGVVIGVVDGTDESVFAFGRSGSEAVPELNGDSAFDPGSVAKTLTATVLADMVSRGEVALDDPIRDVAPEDAVPDEKVASITLLELATHFSGLPSEPSVGRESVDQLYESLHRVKLHSPPGRRFRYSNFGFALLADLLARRAGMDFGDLLTQRVLSPLGMNATCVRTSTPHARAVQGFVGANGRPAKPRVRLPGPGSLWTTANDMLEWIRANLSPDRTPLADVLLLTHQARRQHRKIIAVRPGRRMTIGLAWAIDPSGVMFHTGGTSGFMSYCGLRNRTSRGVVALMNLGIGERPPAKDIPATALVIVRAAISIPKLLDA